MGPDVFLDALGPHVEDERAALCHVTSLADDGIPPSLTIRASYDQLSIRRYS
jgi:hypothetical protein